jgi:hypothetical protein
MLQSISRVGPREAASSSATTFVESGILKARNTHNARTPFLYTCTTAAAAAAPDGDNGGDGDEWR